MGVIIEPVISWEIKIRTLFHGEYLNDGMIKTVTVLRSYFMRFKRRGEVWGYVLQKNRPLAGHDEWVEEVMVILEYTDKTGPTRNEFYNLTDFVFFLHEHPAIAKVLQYEPRFKK
jgi:hypothetical protein